MKLTIEIPDEIADRVVNNFCAAHGYSEGAPELAEKILTTRLFETAAVNEISIARDSAETAARKKATSEIIAKQPNIKLVSDAEK